MAGCPFNHGASRRGFLAAAGTLLAGAASAATTAGAASASTTAGSLAASTAKGVTPASQATGRLLTIPFEGRHQAGIATALQNHTCFTAFDVTTTDRAALIDLLRRWTAATRRLVAGQTAVPLEDADAPPDPGRSDPQPQPDSGDALGLAPARLSVTIGFGPTLFEQDGHDRFGLARHRPEALATLPNFHGDQLQPARTGGDISIQACADDPQVAFHAIRQLAQMAYGVADLRWMQTGFVANAAATDTPRNLLGFKDGTQNPIAAQPVEQTASGTITPGSDDEIVWVGADGPAWMQGGSYVVARRIRLSLEHWDRSPVAFQEQVIGRHKRSGAPLGRDGEFDPLDLDAVDHDGNPLIADNAHVRLGAAASNGGAQMLRRSYSYNDGANFTAERWPPWRQAVEFDAGLLFICYQRDPRTSFSRIFDRMSKFDALNQYATHTGGGLFACPGGVTTADGYVGQGLFEA